MTEETFLLGMALSKIEFWSSQYEFSFQFWGERNNNVFINRSNVEVASFGGENNIKDILDRTIEWCEKANPSKEYPLSVYTNSQQLQAFKSKRK